MSIIQPEIEVVDRATQSVRYLEHGWPTELCRWHSHREYELHLITATRGKAFVGDYIGDFSAGALFLTGPNLPHNWITDEVYKKPVEVRDMMVQFSQGSLDRLATAFPEFLDLRPMLTLAQSGIRNTGALVLAVHLPHGEYVYNPKGDQRLERGRRPDPQSARHRPQ